MSTGDLSLLENRRVAYEAAFLGELPYEPQPEESDIGLSGLWRAYSRKNGPPGNKLGPILEEIPATVGSILIDHEAHSRSDRGDDGEAVFSLIEPESTLPILADITSRVMYFWGMGLGRNGYLPLSSSIEVEGDAKFNLGNMINVRSIVIETAASAMQVLPVFAEKPDAPTKGEKENLARILANWGPQFLVEWLDGTIVNKWFDEKGVNEVEKQEWQTILTEGVLKHFAVHNLRNPLDGLSRAIENYQALTDHAIAHHLNWTEEEVTEIFTPSIRKNFAVGHITDPFVAVDKVRDNLEILTPCAIAERLGWTEEEVTEIFTPSLIVEFATRKVGSPLGAIDKVRLNIETLTTPAIAERLGWTEEEVLKAIPNSTRRQLAISNIDNPMHAVERFVANVAALTDEAIADHIGWTKSQVAINFTPGIRREFAIGSITDPLQTIEKVKANLEALTDKAIADRLGWTAQKAADVFTPTMRRSLAISHINKLWRAVERVSSNLDVLTDEAIAEKLGWNVDKVTGVFHPSMRKYFAIKYISNPLKAVVDYAAGNLSVSGKYIHDRIEV